MSARLVNGSYLEAKMGVSVAQIVVPSQNVVPSQARELTTNWASESRMSV
jgi:hypothetical protein